MGVGEAHEMATARRDHQGRRVARQKRHKLRGVCCVIEDDDTAAGGEHGPPHRGCRVDVCRYLLRRCAELPQKQPQRHGRTEGVLTTLVPA